MSNDKSDAPTICGYSRNLSKRDEAKKLTQSLRKTNAFGGAQGIKISRLQNPEAKTNRRCNEARK